MKLFLKLTDLQEGSINRNLDLILRAKNKNVLDLWFIDEYDLPVDITDGVIYFTIKNKVEISYGSDVLLGGVASADAEADFASNACDNDLETRWIAGEDPLPHWWKYDFGIGVTRKIRKLRIKPTDKEVKDFTLQGSNNDSDWTDIYTGQHGNNGDLEDFIFSNENYYRYYKLLITSNWINNTYASIIEIEMREVIDLEKTITSFLDSQNGNAQIELTEDETKYLEGNYLYSIEIKLDSKNSITVAEGQICFKKSLRSIDIINGDWITGEEFTGDWKKITSIEYNPITGLIRIFYEE